MGLNRSAEMCVIYLIVAWLIAQDPNIIFALSRTGRICYEADFKIAELPACLIRSLEYSLLMTRVCSIWKSPDIFHPRNACDPEPMTFYDDFDYAISEKIALHCDIWADFADSEFTIEIEGCDPWKVTIDNGSLFCGPTGELRLLRDKRYKNAHGAFLSNKDNEEVAQDLQTAQQSESTTEMCQGR